MFALGSGQLSDTQYSDPTLGKCRYHLSPIDHAELDLLRQGDLFLPGQQRNLGHLREIHADRIPPGMMPTGMMKLQSELGQPFFAVRFDGKIYDCGSKIGFLTANVAYALDRDDLRTDFTAEIHKLI